MAVVGGDPIDLALDRIASLFEDPRQRITNARAYRRWASDVAALWRSIMDHASARGDQDLYSIAHEQYGYFNHLADMHLTAPP